MIEICCGGYHDALIANKSGVKRIELNSALALGGLTPSVATLKLIKAATNLEVIAMVRVRPGGFNYNENELEESFVQARELLLNGADGIAFGCLNENYTINEEAVAEFVFLTHSLGKKFVFHRAFDLTNDLNQSIETLIKLNVDRVLTSGGYKNAIDGKDNLKELVKRYGNQIEILAGSGINATNVKSLIEYTGVKQVHSSCRSYQIDKTASNQYLSFGYHEENDYECVDLAKVQELILQCGE